MKFLISVLMCAAFAATIVADRNGPWCTTDQIRDIVVTTCFKSIRERRQARELTASTGNEHRMRAYRDRLPRIPQHMLPENVTLVAVRKRTRRQRPDLTDLTRDYYFRMCCRDIEYCKSLDCP